MTIATSDSKTATVGTTATQLDWPVFYADVVVENLGPDDVWVTTDGSQAVAGEDGALVVIAGEFGVYSNRLPIPDITQPDWPGTTSVSLITLTGSSEVVVSPQ